jgi:hypothetical protein
VTIKYQIDYQYMSKGAVRPHDDGEVVGIEATSEQGLVLLPNVGDFVSIDNSADGGERTDFHGKVQSRVFRYVRTKNEIFCLVNIVVAETDDDWGKLVKE